MLTLNGMASRGQTWAHTSHPVHISGSIQASGRPYFSSSSVLLWIAGQPMRKHSAQPLHFSAITSSGCHFLRSSGSSTHVRRLATIRELHARTGLVIDPHTADGVKVAREHLKAGVPMICLETALPAKFAETIIEAIGREPPRPAGYADLERRPQRFTVLPADVARLKAYVEAHAR